MGPRSISVQSIIKQQKPKVNYIDRDLFISLNEATVSRPSSVGIVAQGWPLELEFLSHNCYLVVKRRLQHFQASIQVQDRKKEKGQMKVQKGNVFTWRAIAFLSTKGNLLLPWPELCSVATS